MPVPILALALVLSSAPVDEGCGAERRAVKTLTDREATSVALAPTPATVEQLVQLPPPPYHEGRSRNDVERTVYAVSAKVVGFKLEAGDGDFHVVIAGDSGATMIVELPDPACASGSPVMSQITEARRAFTRRFGQPLRGVFRRLVKPIRARVVGVGFFDRLHRQTGVAPNGIELHPVLRVDPAEPSQPD